MFNVCSTLLHHVIQWINNTRPNSYMLSLQCFVSLLGDTKGIRPVKKTESWFIVAPSSSCHHYLHHS